MISCLINFTGFLRLCVAKWELKIIYSMNFCLWSVWLLQKEVIVTQQSNIVVIHWPGNHGKWFIVMWQFVAVGLVVVDRTSVFLSLCILLLSHSRIPSHLQSTVIPSHPHVYNDVYVPAISDKNYQTQKPTTINSFEHRWNSKTKGELKVSDYKQENYGSIEQVHIAL